VLAVTYPAREYGIKRGDSWEDVATKSNNQCISIHLPIIPIQDKDNNNDITTTTTLAEEKYHIDNGQHHSTETESRDIEYSNNNNNNNIDQEAFHKEFHLSKEEQQKFLKEENGVQMYHHQGKASLERYRLASRVIFTNVLESLKRRVGRGFILEKASIDEFYLDITDYCYGDSDGKNDNDNGDDSKCLGRTKVVADQEYQSMEAMLKMENPDDVDMALRRACQLSAWIRNDVWKTLGFTMSAGISTNKMMAKLTAFFGKPNGQAVLHPRNFASLMAQTQVRKVRNFGGKLGKRALELLHTHTGNHQSLEDFSSTATMSTLATVPLPVLQTAFSIETAQFVFQACQGIDHELVNETSGALVKSITAFKSFTANKNHGEVHTWLKLLAKEITDRVTQDAARNHRYPKTCTLNYNYYTTADGKRPRGTTSARAQRQSRSYRLNFPAERESITQKSQSLVEQAMAKLAPILKEHPLRGVGLAVSNFDSRGQPPEGNTSIESFFGTGDVMQSPSPNPNESQGPRAMSLDFHPERETKNVQKNKRQKTEKIVGFGTLPISTKGEEISTSTSCTSINNHPPKSMDSDLEMAKKLQASFDRENFIFSKINNCRKGKATKSSNQTMKRIDSFFTKR
jgi:DNA polymerase eta